MKATVMESKNGRSVILSEDGIFRNVKGIYETGELIEYNEARFALASVLKPVIAAAACLVIVFCGWFYSYQNLKVYAAVTLEGENSVTLELNRRNKVIAVKSDSKEGEELVKKLYDDGIKGKHIEKAIPYAKSVMEESTGDTVKIKNGSDDPQKGSELNEMIEKYNDENSELPDRHINNDEGDAEPIGKKEKPAKIENQNIDNEQCPNRKENGDGTGQDDRKIEPHGEKDSQPPDNNRYAPQRR